MLNNYDNDILGNALNDYQHGKRCRLYINNEYGNKEYMPLSVYFRSFKQMNELEQIALEACTGKVLDIGAAAGSHALVLQQRKLKVTALDISPGACEVMIQRGVNNVVNDDIFKYKKQKFDTLLLLMNGIGLAQTLDGLTMLLITLKQLLKPSSQILFDSSDINYLYQNINKPIHYYGEINYSYQYKGRCSHWFKWLYIDKEKMHRIASNCGYEMSVLFEDKHQQYLARLKKR